MPHAHCPNFTLNSKKAHTVPVIRRHVLGGNFHSIAALSVLRRQLLQVGKPAQRTAS
ncbi:hypothetical protein [[Scytonema hofmanni] UTEX B 1581]|uniref:hypothetical protein n=1 Tax=[Scytonema hofmanni] UTEX B 1581 TaxID=379535 RepID=UPI001C8F2162|nr:hypothetical protein [[Scytonema hofmanni] UTEX B 1581]